MGSKIVSLVDQDKEMDLVSIIEKPGHPQIGNYIGEKVKDNLEIEEAGTVKIFVNPFADVIIEFSTPEATLEHMEIAAKYKKAVVIGTTGLKEEHIARVKELAKEIPCVMSPNMSQGVNLLFKLTKEVAQILPDYDVEIVEAHHNQKKDAPSGTALRLAIETRLGHIKGNLREDLNQIIFHGRQGIVGPRKPEEIGIHAVRAGDIVGEHTVIFAGPGERIELIHRAHSRDVFAHGAIKAAKWIVGKPAGLYDMQDVLEIK